jgi:hypothetical protein
MMDDQLWENIALQLGMNLMIYFVDMAWLAMSKTRRITKRICMLPIYARPKVILIAKRMATLRMSSLLR